MVRLFVCWTKSEMTRYTTKISLPSNSTIGDLSNEIATTLEVDVGQLGLFTMQDFELRLKE